MKKLFIIQLVAVFVICSVAVVNAGSAKHGPSGKPVIKTMASNAVKVGTVKNMKIMGKNFEQGATVQVGTLEEGITFAVTEVSVDGKKIKGTLSVPPSVVPGRKAISVTNPSYPDNPAVSKKGVKIIKRPAPSIGEVTPDSAMQGETVDISITGGNFYGYEELTPALSFGEGTVITVNSVLVVSSTLLQANITVDPLEAVGFKSLTVTNPDGKSKTKDDVISVTAATL